MQKCFAGLVLEVESNFLSNPTSQRKVPSLTSKKNVTSRHPCRTWDPCEVVSPEFHALNGWDYTDWHFQVTWDLELGSRVNRPLVFGLKSLDKFDLIPSISAKGPRGRFLRSLNLAWSLFQRKVEEIKARLVGNMLNGSMLTADLFREICEVKLDDSIGDI